MKFTQTCVPYNGVLMHSSCFRGFSPLSILPISVQDPELYCSEVKILFPNIIVELGRGVKNTWLVPLNCQWKTGLENDRCSMCPLFSHWGRMIE